MSILTDIADAVAAELNTGEFSEQFTAIRRVLPVFEIAQLKELKVSVVPTRGGGYAVPTPCCERSSRRGDPRCVCSSRERSTR